MLYTLSFASGCHDKTLTQQQQRQQLARGAVLAWCCSVPAAASQSNAPVRKKVLPSTQHGMQVAKLTSLNPKPQ
jgi:hypothetical protein